jgi:hypothetical protein
MAKKQKQEVTEAKGGKAPRKRKTARAPRAPRYRLEVKVSVNGKVGRATLIALDKDDRVCHTDKLDPLDAAERGRVARRMAKTLRVKDAGRLQADLDKVCNEAVEAQQRLSEQPSAGPAESPPADGAAAPTQSQALVELAGDAELFHTPEGDPYATVKVGDHAETWPIRSKGFRRWLAAGFFDRHGKPPGSQAMQDALNVLEGKAVFAGGERQVFVRLAEHAGRIYLDLADPAWRAIEVDARGWRVVENPPVRFRRTKGMLALPEPARGGSLDQLRAFVNLPRADAADAADALWLLLVCWLTAALRPRGPYLLLVLAGEQGTAKSTLATLLRSLLDPSVTPLRSEPREVRDLMIAATSGWLVAFDNLSRLPQWLSDALCRLATGGGFATRELYTDAEEVLFNAQRPALLTSIEEVVTAGDLLDRSLPLRLEPIPDDRRRTEEELWAAWEEVRPRVLGALLDAVSAGLRLLPSVRLDRLPRMADFARWAEAVGRGLGWKPGAALAAYRVAIGEATQLALEASVVTGPVLALLENHSPWEGTARELLEHLTRLAGEKSKDRDWPGKPHLLSGQLRRLAPSLRRVGVEVAFSKVGKRRTRTIHLGRRVEQGGQTASAASASARHAENPGENEVDGGRSADAGGRPADAGGPGRASAANPCAASKSSRPADAADAADAAAHPNSDDDGTGEPGGGGTCEAFRRRPEQTHQTHQTHPPGPDTPAPAGECGESGESVPPGAESHWSDAGADDVWPPGRE